MINILKRLIWGWTQSAVGQKVIQPAAANGPNSSRDKRERESTPSRERERKRQTDRDRQKERQCVLPQKPFAYTWKLIFSRRIAIYFIYFYFAVGFSSFCCIWRHYCAVSMTCAWIPSALRVCSLVIIMITIIIIIIITTDTIYTL